MDFGCHNRKGLIGIDKFGHFVNGCGVVWAFWIELGSGNGKEAFLEEGFLLLCVWVWVGGALLCEWIWGWEDEWMDDE